MKENKREKNLELDRLVFFCDAVVAIAITLLALNLKLNKQDGRHLCFKDLLAPWKMFLAFLLSFINIASFWKNHHSFFVYIKKIDEKLLWYNIFWLFFIVLLPFSTTLVSAYFFDTPAIFLYSLNTFVVTFFQNSIWDYAALTPGFLKEDMDPQTATRFRLYCNLDMLNGLIAIAVSFFYPVLAFVLLLTKLPMMVLARIYLTFRVKRQLAQKNDVTHE